MMHTKTYRNSRGTHGVNSLVTVSDRLYILYQLGTASKGKHYAPS